MAYEHIPPASFAVCSLLFYCFGQSGINETPKVIMKFNYNSSGSGMEMSSPVSVSPGREQRSSEVKHLYWKQPASSRQLRHLREGVDIEHVMKAPCHLWQQWRGLSHLKFATFFFFPLQLQTQDFLSVAGSDLIMQSRIEAVGWIKLSVLQIMTGLIDGLRFLWCESHWCRK